MMGRLINGAVALTDARFGNPELDARDRLGKLAKVAHQIAAHSDLSFEKAVNDALRGPILVDGFELLDTREGCAVIVGDVVVERRGAQRP